MKRLLCFLLCLFSLLLTACSSNDQMKNEAKEYEHTPYVSSIEQADCFLCGESKKDLVNLILEQGFFEYCDFINYVLFNCSDLFFDVASGNTIFFNSYLKSAKFKDIT